jgi:hypothetical protein
MSLINEKTSFIGEMTSIFINIYKKKEQIYYSKWLEKLT